MGKFKQRPLRLADAGKRDVRTQFGALCWRMHGDGVQILLVTSKRKRRWILPKGWPMDGETPAGAAETEAWEEAGVNGKVSPIVLGMYSYRKELPSDPDVPCVVAIFPLKVKRVADNWPEKSKRRRKWMSPKKAASLVDEPELASILRSFDPTHL